MTSKIVGSEASRVLRTPRYSPLVKAPAASALAQRPRNTLRALANAKRVVGPRYTRPR
jgi:hypothetical protein